MRSVARSSRGAVLIAFAIAAIATLQTPVRPARSSEDGAGPRITQEQLRQIRVFGFFEGHYFIGADSSDVVIIRYDLTRTRGLKLESPGEWKGEGSHPSGIYEGTFVYGRHPVTRVIAECAARTLR